MDSRRKLTQFSILTICLVALLIEGVPAKNGIKITANTGVAAANGLYYYLKNIANCSTSWSGDQLHTLPLDSLPMPAKAIEVVIQDKFRYYQNVCTVSYSMVWWSWARWERELDWMALRGINLPLAFNGQESVFRQVFINHFNMTKAQADNYFSGPAFLAWNRMGNMQTWSGPLSEHWHEQQEKLQKQILARMRDFGMYPVVPGFAGHVPRDLVINLPKAKIDRLPDWGSFGTNYSHTYFLQPEDPNFSKINELFIQEYIKLFGTDHFYNIDLFNEETPSHSDPQYLHSAGKGVYDSIVKADPNGIWVMQGWLFVNQPGFWKQPQVKAMVQSVPIGKLLILDLFSDVKPIYSHFEGYYGQPFIFCMLHNFGGTLGMYGSINRINAELYTDRKKYSNLLGIGLTPEGIEQNPVAYEYMMDTTWHSSTPDMAKWFTNYSVRRYGLYDARLDKAWQLLRVSVYTDPIGVHNHGQYAINKRPKISYHSPLWYQPANLTDALKLMAGYLEANPAIVNKSETFVYDMVDVSRQALQLIFDYYREHQMYPQYVKHEVAHLKTTSNQMLH
ncbi:PREDICTED: alpha-N-acetylglucosaminidase-like, partial [Rhagoletis zephyria]|uniref:alpha-N-acetylglucosaminidase-like n=1 Tax=Rhagoletis zephyria TaxID=28612 RepID=UPI0008115571